MIVCGISLLPGVGGEVASGSSGAGLSPGRGHCVVFLSKTLYSDRASLHPGVQIMGTGELNAGGGGWGWGNPGQP